MASQPTRSRGATQIDEGLALHRQGRLDEAAKLYGAVASDDPAYPDARHLLGVVALARGQLNAADQLIGHAIALSPNATA